ncbi:MAG: single-stranded DNA-binding protein [Actinomycetota bacterium]
MQEPGGAVPPAAQEDVMFNEAQLCLSGYVATEPKLRSTSSGRSQVTMRVAWTPRWIDRMTGEWADGQTSFLTVVCWRKLADNVATCIRKGDPVLVKGRLTVRPYDDKEGVSRLAVEVDAASVGHDLSRGVAHFQRTTRAAGQPAAPGEAGQDAMAQDAMSQDAATQDSPTSFGADPFSAGDGIIDEGAIAALTQEADAVPAPF